MTNKSKRKKILKQELRKERRQSDVRPVKDIVVKLVKKEAHSLEEFSEFKELADLTKDRIKTFYNQGIRSIADFASWTEQELLALNGIGPATLKKLAVNGVQFKV